MTPTWEMVELEQRECAALFASLTDEEWQVETLCVGWTVRDMLTHIASAITTDLSQTMRAIRLRHDVHRLNQETIEAWNGRRPESLIDKIERSRVPSLGQRILGPSNSLRALVIHCQDIRRPLGQPASLDPDRVRAVLDAVLEDAGGNLGSVERSEGLRFVATDMEWSHGTGPEVTGYAEAILMAVAGRFDALADLGGPGVATLATR